jgi:DNA polymerase III epsilon subunit-like protein
MSRIYVAVDLETTGLDPERDAILEIGAVKFRDDRV